MILTGFFGNSNNEGAFDFHTIGLVTFSELGGLEV